MNRRGFLRSLIAGAAAVAVLDPEKLLWVPGAKTIFVPPVELGPNFDLIDSITLEHIRSAVIYDNIFRDDPICAKLRSRVIESFDGGSWTGDVL